VDPNRLLPWLIAVAMAVIVVLVLAIVFGAFGSL
jgi:hypothetical protein